MLYPEILDVFRDIFSVIKTYNSTKKRVKKLHP